MNDPQMTLEQAEDNLAKAIADYAVINGTADTDTHMMGDWAVIAHWQPIVDDERSRYSTAYTRGHLPQHVAVGLFTTGLDILSDTSYEEEP